MTKLVLLSERGIMGDSLRGITLSDSDLLLHEGISRPTFFMGQSGLTAQQTKSVKDGYWRDVDYWKNRVARIAEKEGLFYSGA